MVETVAQDDSTANCERCGQNIKQVWTCTVDADSERLVELGGQRTWRIGSTCGPTLLLISEETWGDRAKPLQKRIRLALRTQRLLACAGLSDGLRTLLEKRQAALLAGTLEDRLQRHMSLVVTSNGRRYRLWQ